MITRHFLVTGIVLSLSAFSSAGFAADEAKNPAILSMDFEKAALGVYSDAAIKASWPKVQWASPQGRASIVEDPDAGHGKALRIAYPKGALGPGEGGTQFLVQLPPADEYWLSYSIKFEPGFDFRKGGKLPGLTSGGGKYTGGHKPANGEGWSARYMFKGDGGVIVYFYSVDMPGKWGEGLPLKGARFIPGKWHRLTQHIRINSPNAKDGLIEVWFDGKPVYRRTGIRYRIGNAGRIDSLYFSTFHGGNTRDWAPLNDSAARFDDFAISTQPPEELKPAKGNAAK